MSVREMFNKNYECATLLQNGWETVFTTLPTIADLAILLVVVHVIFLTATNPLKMKMMPAPGLLSNSNFATQDLNAIFSSIGRGRSLSFFGM